MDGALSLYLFSDTGRLYGKNEHTLTQEEHTLDMPTPPPSGEGVLELGRDPSTLLQ